MIIGAKHPEKPKEIIDTLGRRLKVVDTYVTTIRPHNKETVAHQVVLNDGEVVEIFEAIEPDIKKIY